MYYHLYVFLIMFVFKCVRNELFEDCCGVLDIALVDQSSTLQGGASLQITYQLARKLSFFVITLVQHDVAELMGIVEPVFSFIGIVQTVCHVQSCDHLDGLVDTWKMSLAEKSHVGITLAEIGEVIDQD